MDQDTVKNEALLEQALTCSGYANDQKQKGNDIKDNRPLATIGDKLLSFLFLKHIESLGLGTTMEQLTDFNELIQHNGIQNEIGKLIFINNLEPRSFNNELAGKKAYATCLEAYIYAIYKTKGMHAAWIFLKDKVAPIMKSKTINDTIHKVLESKDTSNGKKWSTVEANYNLFLKQK